MSLSLCFRKAIIRLGRDQLSRQEAKHFVLAKASEDCLIEGRASCSRASFVTSWDSAVSLGLGKPRGPVRWRVSYLTPMSVAVISSHLNPLLEKERAPQSSRGRLLPTECCHPALDPHSLLLL